MYPVCEPNISDRERDLVSDAVATGWVSSQGKYLDEFQSGLSDYFGLEHVVCVSSGTAALETACHGIDLQPGDEVVIPSFTITSVANVLFRFGAVPVLADVDESTWNISAEEVERLLTPKTRAIIVVHSFGHPADMKALQEIATTHDLKIIEDCAEAISSEYDGNLCGTMGDVAAFSFYANKLITTGEGGAVATNDAAIADRMRRYINMYFGDSERFAHSDLGFNYRMTNMQAALGVGQLARIDYFIERKLELGDLYKSALASLPVRFQPTTGPVKHVYWMYSVLLDEQITKTVPEVMSSLGELGVGTRTLFKGLHQQPHISPYVREGQQFPVTEHLYDRGFYLPSSVSLVDEDIKQIAGLLENAIVK